MSDAWRRQRIITAMEMAETFRRKMQDESYGNVMRDTFAKAEAYWRGYRDALTDEEATWQKSTV